MRDHPKAHLLAYALAGVLVAIAAVRLLGGGHDDGPRSPIRLDGGGASAAVEEGGAAGSRIYVHVAGAVRRPGLYRLASRSRVAAAVERAGGPARNAELSALNLAAALEDGQQVLVPRRGAGGPTAAVPQGAPGAAGTAGAAPGAQAGAGAKISLATATVEQLDGLDGIGPTLAKRIVAYRDEHGGFRSVGELREVEGIGPKRFEALEKSVRP